MRWRHGRKNEESVLPPIAASLFLSLCDGLGTQTRPPVIALPSHRCLALALHVRCRPGIKEISLPHPHPVLHGAPSNRSEQSKRGIRPTPSSTPSGPAHKPGDWGKLPGGGEGPTGRDVSRRYHPELCKPQSTPPTTSSLCIRMYVRSCYAVS